MHRLLDNSLLNRLLASLVYGCVAAVVLFAGLHFASLYVSPRVCGIFVDYIWLPAIVAGLFCAWHGGRP